MEEIKITLEKLAEMVQRGFRDTKAEIVNTQHMIRDVESHLTASINALDIPRLRGEVVDHEERLLRIEEKLGIKAKM